MDESEFVSHDEQTLEVLSKQLADLKGQKDYHTDMLSQVNAAIDDTEKILIEQMDLNGVESFKSSYGTVSKSEKTYFNVGNFDELCAFVAKTGRWSLFQRRVTTEAVRDAIENLGGVPGVSEFKKQVISFRRKK